MRQAMQWSIPLEDVGISLLDRPMITAHFLVLFSRMALAERTRTRKHSTSLCDFLFCSRNTFGTASRTTHMYLWAISGLNMPTSGPKWVRTGWPKDAHTRWSKKATASHVDNARRVRWDHIEPLILIFTMAQHRTPSRTWVAQVPES